MDQEEKEFSWWNWCCAQCTRRDQEDLQRKTQARYHFAHNQEIALHPFITFSHASCCLFIDFHHHSHRSGGVVQVWRVPLSAAARQRHRSKAFRRLPRTVQHRKNFFHQVLPSRLLISQIHFSNSLTLLHDYLFVCFLLLYCIIIHYNSLICAVLCRYLLESDYPGMNIGPEPTTDRFVAIMHNPESLVIPGNALAARADMPFRALNKYGVIMQGKRG